MLFWGEDQDVGRFHYLRGVNAPSPMGATVPASLDGGVTRDVPLTVVKRPQRLARRMQRIIQPMDVAGLSGAATVGYGLLS